MVDGGVTVVTVVIVGLDELVDLALSGRPPHGQAQRAVRRADNERPRQVHRRVHVEHRVPLALADALRRGVALGAAELRLLAVAKHHACASNSFRDHQNPMKAPRFQDKRL